MKKGQQTSLFFTLQVLFFSLSVSVVIGDEAADVNDPSWNMDSSTVVRVKTLHISSPILAAKSPFFYKVWIRANISLGILCFFDLF